MYCIYCAQSTTKQLIMPTENTSLKNVTPARDSNSTAELVIGKSSIYQHLFFIVAGSLLTALFLVAVAGNSGSQHLSSSSYDPDADTGAVADYQVDTGNLALAKDIFFFSLELS